MNQRPIQEQRFAAHDGVEIFYRHWPAAGPSHGAIVVFHRGHEHSGRVAHLPDELGMPDYDFFAWDARGHGVSPGARGHAPSFGTLVRDVQTFVDHIGTQHRIGPDLIAVVAQSVGAVIAATWVHDYAPKIRALVLASPAFSVKLYVPFARQGLALLRRIRGDFDVTSYVKSKFLTHDEARRVSFDSDPLITRAISVDILLALYEASERVVADAAAITVPTQLLVSGDDFVVRREPQDTFYQRLGSTVKEQHVLPGFFHDTLGERGREQALAKVRSFLVGAFGRPVERLNRLDAHERGFTHDEATLLATPFSSYSPRGMYWNATRAALRFGARFSDSLKLGQDTGFDSGSTLDFVYRNETTSRSVFGRVIDRGYLDAVGWRGIRMRKRHLEALLATAIRRLRHRGAPVRIVDIAAGHGRYVLDAVTSPDLRPDAILLRDYSEKNVQAGRALIVERGLADIARFDRGDAFDRADLAALSPRPTIAVVSGLYELFADNERVGGSLKGLGEAIEPGGLLVYTGQPWHPQLEFIARALTSHREGAAWVMRRRTQDELDQLVEAAGFKKAEQRIDEWGIFTVSLAERC